MLAPALVVYTAAYLLCVEPVVGFDSTPSVPFADLEPYYRPLGTGSIRGVHPPPPWVFTFDDYAEPFFRPAHFVDRRVRPNHWSAWRLSWPYWSDHP